MLWRRAITCKIAVFSPAQRTNKNVVLAHLEYNIAVVKAILASKIQSAIIRIPEPAVVATILAVAVIQPTESRVRNLVVSNTMFDDFDDKRA